MGIETMYSAVMGGLSWLVLALSASATPRLFQECCGRRSEKLAGLGLPPFRDWKPRSSKSSPPSEPIAPAPPPALPAAHPAADANAPRDPDAPLFPGRQRNRRFPNTL